ELRGERGYAAILTATHIGAEARPVIDPNYVVQRCSSGRQQSAKFRVDQELCPGLLRPNAGTSVLEVAGGNLTDIDGSVVERNEDALVDIAATVVSVPMVRQNTPSDGHRHV